MQRLAAVTDTLVAATATLVAATATLVAATVIQTAILTARVMVARQMDMAVELPMEVAEVAAMVEALVVTGCLT